MVPSDLCLRDGDETALQFGGGAFVGGLGLWPLGEGRRDALDDVGERGLAGEAATVVLLSSVLRQRMLHHQLGLNDSWKMGG